MKAALLLSLCAVACGANLPLPAGVVIACDTDAECPSGMRCQGGGQCVPLAKLDTTPPQLVSAIVVSPIAIVLSFDEALDPASAAITASYTATPALAIDDATPGADGQTVVLDVERQIDGAPYELAVGAVTDLAGNAIAAGATAHFTGVGPTIDHSAPQPLAPYDGQRIYGTLDVGLSWTPRSGANTYIVEVALINGDDPASFAAPIAGSPFSVSPTQEGGVPPATLQLTLPDSGAYYWQAHADTTGATEQLVPARFDVVSDTIYVSCPQSRACSVSAGTGSRTAPFETLSTALAQATLRGIKRVEVAARGGAASYNELATLADGMSLFGGYTSDFTARDAATHATIISAPGPVAILGAHLTQPITIDGFVVKGSAVATVSTIELSDVASATISNCQIDGGTPATSSVGVSIDQPAGKPGQLFLSNVQVSSGPAHAGSFGVSANGTRLTIDHATITAADTTGTSVAVYSTSDTAITDSSLTVGVGQFTSVGVSSSVSDASQTVTIQRSHIRVATSPAGRNIGVMLQARAALLADNDIDIGASLGASKAVFAFSPALTLVNNTIIVSDTQPTDATSVIYATGLLLANNVIIMNRASPSTSCVSLDQNNPTRIESNFYAGCSAFIATASDPNDCGSYTTLNGTPTSCSGNFTSATLADAEANFSNFAAADYTLSASADARLLRGGIDASGDTYGDVTVNLRGTPRTCAGATCYSIGAY